MGTRTSFVEREHLDQFGDRQGAGTLSFAGGGRRQPLQELVHRGTGSIEADYLNGEIVLLGRLHDVPTPVNQVLQRLATSAAREGRRPGTLPLAELIQMLPPDE